MKRLERRKLYKKKSRKGIRGVKESLVKKISILNDDLVESKKIIAEVKNERMDWESKFYELERYKFIQIDMYWCILTCSLTDNIICVNA